MNQDSSCISNVNSKIVDESESLSTTNSKVNTESHTEEDLSVPENNSDNYVGPDHLNADVGSETLIHENNDVILEHTQMNEENQVKTGELYVTDNDNNVKQ